jgi:hypothetical protein
MTPRRTPLAALASALLLLLGVWACEDGTSPEVERLAIDPPRLYEVWWSEMEACSGLRGERSGVSWFVAFQFPQGVSILGQWNSRREITLRSDVWLERYVVAHEILHDLLGGDLRHEDDAWTRCEIPVGIDTG